MVEPPVEQLLATWNGAVDRFGADPASTRAVFDDLCERHREPHRRYHTLEHVGEVLDAAVQLEEGLGLDTTSVTLAIWFHDSIYDPRTTTSEEQSANLALEALTPLGVPPGTTRRVVELIRMTAGHQAGTASDERILADADLWILGAPGERYDRYASDVRHEFGHLADDDWREGRRRVLEDFLARDRLYQTELFHELLDLRARQNMARERDSLTRE